MILSSYLKVILVISFTITGCSSSFYQIKFSPISKDDPLQKLIGKTCNINQAWYLIGWENFDNNGVIDSYVLKPQDNARSRHIKDVIKLEPMIKITLTSIKESDDWKPLSERYNFYWDVENTNVAVYTTLWKTEVKEPNFNLCNVYEQ